MNARAYYELGKPGLVYANILSAIAGFFVASLHTSLSIDVLLGVVFGLGLIIASACAINNYFDQEIDARMERTKMRALPAGLLSNTQVVLFGATLGLVGAGILFWLTTFVALGVAVFGWVSYVALYTPLKPRHPSALFVGAIAGAVPPVVGYSAVTGTLDWYAGALFAALYIWQIPHFLAIAMYRYTDYASAGVPLLVKREPSERSRRHARRVFYASLVVLLLGCFALIFQRWIR